jgi:hypothetical protein
MNHYFVVFAVFFRFSLSLPFKKEKITNRGKNTATEVMRSLVDCMFVRACRYADSLIFPPQTAV